MSELAFFTAQELISELMRRKTFCGVVVHAMDEQKQQQWPDERHFKVHYNHNLDSNQASRLLDTVAEYMQIQSD